jgi:hypothetical protein
MATPTAIEARCTACGKAKGIFLCHGCAKDLIAPQAINVHCDHSPTSFMSQIIIDETAHDYFEPILAISKSQITAKLSLIIR